MRIASRVARAAAIGVFSLPAHAGAATVGFSSDATFLSSAAFTKIFGAQSRWGNGAANGDWEVGLVDATSTPLAGAQLQVAWSTLPGYAATPNHSLEFVYDPAQGDLRLLLRDVDSTPFANASAEAPAGSVNALAIRARADGGDVASLSSLRIDFASGGFFELGALAGDADAEYLMLVDNRLATGFTISGDATLRDGRGSLPMYEFKLGVTPVPVPAAAWLLLSGVAGLAATRRRRSPQPSSCLK